MTEHMRAAVMRRAGGPEVLRVEQIPEPVPAAGESVIDVVLAGVNYDDVQRRSGDEPQPLPAVLGVEVVGRRRSDGRRVAAFLRQGGGYAQVAVAKNAHIVELPAVIDDRQAIGLLEQGSTGYGALTLAGRLSAGESVAVSAAAGGVGHLTIQLAVALGASTVIGIASTPEKRDVVMSLGADSALDPAGSRLAERLLDVSGGGVDLFVDSVGGDVARAAVAGLAPFGRLVCIGWHGGAPVTPSVPELMERSVGCSGFWMRHVVDDRPMLDAILDRLFHLAAQGRLVARIDRVVSLDEVGSAHAALAARVTTGKLLVDVNREA